MYNPTVSEHGLLIAFGQALPSLNRHSPFAFAAIPCLPEGHSKSSWWKTPAAAKKQGCQLCQEICMSDHISTCVWPHIKYRVILPKTRKYRSWWESMSEDSQRVKDGPTCSNKNPTNHCSHCSQKAQFGTMQEINMEFAWTSWDDAGERAGFQQWKHATKRSRPSNRISFYRWWNGEMVPGSQVQCIVPTIQPIPNHKAVQF